MQKCGPFPFPCIESLYRYNRSNGTCGVLIFDTALAGVSEPTDFEPGKFLSRFDQLGNHLFIDRIRRYVHVIERVKGVKVRKSVLLTAAVAAFCTVAAINPVWAATLIINGSGKLTGATGVDVGGTLFDVSLADGTCSGVYGGCETSRFDFHSANEALLAAKALLSQVYIGQFDTDVQHIYGCSSPTAFCDSIIPFERHDTAQFGSTFNFAAIHNWRVADDAGTSETQPYNKDWADVFPVIAGGVSITYDTTAYPENDGVNWARFTPSAVAAVPESSTWVMMLLGFGAIGIALRQRRPVLARQAS